MTTAELTVASSFVSAIVTAVLVYAGVKATARNAAASNTTERERLASQEIHDAIERAKTAHVACEERIRLAEVAADVAHIRADEADVRASEAEGTAAGLAYRLELCEAHRRAVDAAEALRILTDGIELPPD